MSYDSEMDRISTKLRNKNSQRDVTDIIRAIMMSPVSSKLGTDIIDVDGTRPIDTLKGKPLDVQTAMLLGVTSKALKTTDLKCIELLLKYGGYEPPKQQQVTVDLPEFVDTIELRAAMKAEADSVVVEAVVPDVKEEDALDVPEDDHGETAD